MVKKLSHVAIAVKNLEESTKLFSRLFGVDGAKTEVVDDQKVKIAFLRVGDFSIELTEGTAPASSITKFIEKRGEGIHHLSFEVDDLSAELVRLKGEGIQLIDEHPRPGAGGYLIAFLHPKSTNGVLVELSQKMHEE